MDSPLIRTAAFERGWERLPAEMRQKIVADFIESILYCGNRVYYMVEKVTFHLTFQAMIEGQPPLDESDFSSEEKITAKKEYIKLERVHALRKAAIASTWQFASKYGTDLLVPEIKNARKRVSAHRSYLDTQPFSAWPTDKVEDIALAVDCSNSRAMLDWLNTLEKVLGMDDEAEALGEAKDAKPQSLY